ncbi:MAG: hypothetical protein M3N34_06840 [Pseudomonadota bacterium]|nr:hypothetical protein [Pseudomonadota bacterium]
MNDDMTASIENAVDGATDFVAENVGLVIAGGVAIGLLAAVLMPRKKKRKINKQARNISIIVAELAQALTAQASVAAGKASDAAGKSSDKLGSMSKAITGTVVEQSHDIGKQAQQMAGDAANQLNDSGKAIARAAVKLIGKVRG